MVGGRPSNNFKKNYLEGTFFHLPQLFPGIASPEFKNKNVSAGTYPECFRGRMGSGSKKKGDRERMLEGTVRSRGRDTARIF